MNYNKLYYFYQVGRTGNLTRAAQLLYISQPSLSKAIRDLETDLGVQLFARTNRSVTLTRAGETLFLACADFFSQEGELIERVRTAGLARYQKVNLGHMIYDVVYQIQDPLRHFAAAYPGIHVEPHIYLERSEMTMDLLEGSLDVGLKIFTMDEVIPELDFQVLQEHHLLLVTSASHPLAGLDKVSMFQLRREKFVFLGTDERSTEYRYAWNWCVRCGFQPNIAAALDNVGAVLMMVQSGAGVALLSKFAPLGQMSGLATIPLTNAPMIYSGLFWKRDTASDSVRCFLNHMLAEMT